MKRSLGKIITLILLPLFVLANELCDVSISVDKKNPFVGEEIVLKIEAIQKKLENAMFFDFKIPKSDKYSIKLISKTDQTKGDERKFTKFIYRIKPLQEGNLSIPLSIIVKEANKASVKDFVTGSFDELEMLNTKNTTLKFNPLNLKVKPLKKGVEFIGDFTISSHIDKSKVATYEPVHITYTIKGNGSHNSIDDLFPDFNDSDKFLQKSGDLKFEYIFNSDRSFTIPSTNIKCFNPKTSSYYTLKTKPYHIEVSKIPQEKILDSQNSYPTSSFDLSKILPYLYGLLLFISGFLTCKFKLFSKTKVIHTNDSILEEIAKENNPKNLLKLLLSKDESRFDPFIDDLEALIYQKRGSFKEIKERLLKL